MSINPGTARLAALATTPTAPPAGYCIFYFKNDNVLYIKDSSNIETPIGTASGITSLTGEATGVGPGAAAITLSNSAVIGKVLTGFVAGPSSTVLATDTLLQATQKLQAQITSVAGTNLAGDVTGPFSTTVVAYVGPKTAAQVSTSVDDTLAATASNTASTIVKRDASGNFAANVITASLTGVASGNELPITATTVADYYRGDKTFQPLNTAAIAGFSEAAQDAIGAALTDTTTIDLTYNDFLNQISADVNPGSIGNTELDTGLDATKIADGSVTDTEFQYINSLTSNAQTQISARELLANKATDLTSPDNTKYPTTLATSNALALKQDNITFAAVGATPNANAGTLSAGTLTLQPADSTNPGLLTVLAQVIAGAKTFLGITEIQNKLKLTQNAVDYSIENATVNTTDATETTLMSISTSSNSAEMIEASVVGRRTGGSAGSANDCAAYIRYVRGKNNAGTLTLFNKATPYTSDGDQTTWNCLFDTSGTDIRLRVKGATNNDITWVATIKRLRTL